jgi:hypothetical protein
MRAQLPAAGAESAAPACYEHSPRRFRAGFLLVRASGAARGGGPPTSDRSAGLPPRGRFRKRVASLGSGRKPASDPDGRPLGAPPCRAPSATSGPKRVSDPEAGRGALAEADHPLGLAPAAVRQPGRSSGLYTGPRWTRYSPRSSPPAAAATPIFAPRAVSAQYGRQGSSRTGCRRDADLQVFCPLSSVGRALPW